MSESLVISMRSPAEKALVEVSCVHANAMRADAQKVFADAQRRIQAASQISAEADALERKNLLLLAPQGARLIPESVERQDGIVTSFAYDIEPEPST